MVHLQPTERVPAPKDEWTVTPKLLPLSRRVRYDFENMFLNDVTFERFSIEF